MSAAKAKRVAAQKLILAMVREAGREGAGAAGIARRTGRSERAVRGTLTQLARRGLVLIDNGGGTPRCRDAALGLLPADSDGAKGPQERAVCAALKAAPRALSAAELAERAGVRQIDAGPMLGALAARGVVRSAPGGAAARWEMAKPAAEA